MGESLMFSWLKHAKECKIVQLNWKVSPNWSSYNEEEAVKLYNKLNEKFDVFKKLNFDQTLKQAEIDVLGIDIDNSQMTNQPYYYAVDVAYHELGLNYGAKGETINRVCKKFLRTALILYTCFNVKNGEIIFASPKINPAVYGELESKCAQIEQFMKDEGFEYRFKLFANETFLMKILNPIVEVSSNIADTSELFLRALQLTVLCTDSKPKIINSEPKEKVVQFNEFKIGALVKNKLTYFFNNKKLSAEEIKNLMDKNYCKETFNLKYPLLINKDESKVDNKGRARYWAVLFDEKYYACNDWYENQREKFENWCNTIQNKN